MPHESEKLSAEMARELIKSIEDVEREEAEAMLPSTSASEGAVAQTTDETSAAPSSESDQTQDEAA